MGRRTDKQILADVIAALQVAPIDEVAVTATMSGGVIELAGEVPSHSERLAAVTAATHAATPARVVSAITVAPLGTDFRLTDADVSIEVARALVQSDVPPGSVWFEVKNRIVTLGGTVATGSERARIRHLVQKARGVHFIDNRIVVGATTPAGQ